MAERGWVVTIPCVDLVIYTDGPPYCPDEEAARSQVVDILRGAYKQAGVHVEGTARARWTVRRDDGA